MADFIPATTQLSRIFLIEGRARADHEPDYQSCAFAGSPDWPQGDVTPIRCPSPDQFRATERIGQTFAPADDVTNSFTSHYPLDVLSTFLTLARRRCQLDIQVNLGDCTDPSQFNSFRKKQVYEEAFITSYGSDDLGAFDDDTEINENIDINAARMYEIVPLNFAARGASVVTNPVVDVVFCSKVVCGDCEDEDDGCEIIYAVTLASPGSPGTASDVIYSTDGGANLASDEITTLDNTEAADAIACLGDYAIVASNDDGGMHYKTKALINAGTAANWTRIATGIVVGGEPRDVWSTGTYAFVGGTAGYVYGTSDITAGLTVLDAGNATTNNLNAIHALNDNFAVAAGHQGDVIYTENRTNWTAATAPAVINLQAVWAINRNVWWVGSASGAVYYTLDQGATWTQVTNFPVTLTNVEDIAFHNSTVGYISGSIAGPAGVILRTYDGGYSWVSLPEGAGNLPAADEYTALAACEYNENYIVSVGLADDAADGVYVTGIGT
jgi:hypothetical protein